MQELAKLAGVEQLMDIIQPYAPPEKVPKFDALKPCLWACNLSAADQARVFVRTCVHDRMLPLLTKGQAASEQMSALCKSLKSLCQGVPTDADAILVGGVGEVLELSSFFLTLLDEDAHADPDALERIDTIMAAGSKSNARVWVQKGVQQQAWYKGLESSLHKRFLAYKCMVPEMKQTMEQMKQVGLQGDPAQMKACVGCAWGFRSTLAWVCETRKG